MAIVTEDVVESGQTTEAESEQTTEAESGQTTEAESEQTTEAESEQTTEAESEQTTGTESEQTTSSEVQTDANGSYVIAKYGDSLWAIAATYLGSGYKYTELAELNNKSDPNILLVGEKVYISGTGVTPTKNNSNAVVIDYFGLQTDVERGLYAAWTWDKYSDKTECFEYRWSYDIGDLDGKGNTLWYKGSWGNTDTIDSTDSTETPVKYSSYTAPENAKRVRLVVRPVSKTYGDNDTKYFTPAWSSEEIHDFGDPPTAPAAPSVTLEDLKITAILENLDLNATTINFQVVKRNGTAWEIFQTSTTTIQYLTDEDKAALENGYARYSCNVNPGGEYKVRARSCKGTEYSDWSDYSSSYTTMPSVPAGSPTLSAASETSVYISWDAVDTATSYDIEYTTNKKYFDISNQTSKQTGIETTQYELTGLESGDEYWFRIRAVNSNGESGWSESSSVIIGAAPAAPTTWSSTTTAIVSESLNLYWVHNSEDGSKETMAQLEIYANGELIFFDTIENATYDEEEEEDENRTHVYAFDTTAYPEGTKIEWRVRTAGILNEFGEWSIQRSVDIYAPATLTLTLRDVNDDLVDTMTSFPLYISGLAGPSTQAPIGYHVTITANEAYETVDNLGNLKYVGAGEAVYSEYFDITDALLLELLPGSISLENNITYVVTGTVSMNSGLTATSTVNFKVNWTADTYWPNAEIGIDKVSYTANIRPYCEDVDGNLIDGLTLSVYRREFDGAFTEIITGVPNDGITTITDPHPALDYARYRIVAISDSTGAVGYYDVPGVPVNGAAVIIQWDEAWSNFDTPENEVVAEPNWAGSMLKLPYNISVSNSYKPDVAFVEYIGRDHPVSYYGTQLGSTASWSVNVEKSDEETLYALHRLARWLGDCYVREPSGTGYWANVTVSFNQKYKDLIVPVSLNITRVEGGI